MYSNKSRFYSEILVSCSMKDSYSECIRGNPEKIKEITNDEYKKDLFVFAARDSYEERAIAFMKQVIKVGIDVRVRRWGSDSSVIVIYLMSKLPEKIELEKRLKQEYTKNIYIFIQTEPFSLYYVRGYETFDQINIDNYQVFLDALTKIGGGTEDRRHLYHTDAHRLITSNGGYGPKHSALNEAVISAAQYNNFETLQYLVSEGADVNSVEKNYQEKTALHYATINNNLEMVKFLINAGADTNPLSIYLNHPTPLQEATINNNFEMVKCLVEAGANVNFVRKDYYGYPTALHAAVIRSNFRMVKFLVEAGANVKVVVDDAQDGDTLFHRAVLYQHFHVDTLKSGRWYLLIKDELPNIATSLAELPRGGMVCIKKNGHELNYITKREMSGALFSGMLSAEEIGWETFNKIENNESLKAIKNHLIEIISKKGVNLLKYLIREGADCSRPNNAGQKPLECIDSRETKGLLEVYSTIYRTLTQDEEIALNHSSASQVVNWKKLSIFSINMNNHQPPNPLPKGPALTY